MTLFEQARLAGGTSRALPALAFFLGGLAASPPSPLPADVIELKDGVRLEGKVIELGDNSIAINLERGRKIILKSDLRRLTFTIEPEGTLKLDQDLVICRNGNDLRGKVRLSEDGQSVLVGFEDGSEVAIPRTSVLKIIYRKEGLQESAEGAIYTRAVEEAIRGALADLASPDRAVAGAAEQRLIDYGVFAIQEVEKLRAGEKAPPEAIRDSLDRIAGMHQIKKLVTDKLEEMEPSIYRLLGSASAREKQGLLEEMFTRFPEDSVPVAKYLLMDPHEDADTRAYIIRVLGGLNRNRDLLEVYGRSVGQVQLAAAIALGKNRILIGIPSLIEALDLDDREIRRLAGEALKEFTSLDHGFDPDDTPLSRHRSIEKWKDWWKRNESSIQGAMESILAGQAADSPERRAAEGLWKRAGEALAAGKVEEAEALLRSAAETAPTFINVRVHLAVLLYTQLHRVEEAQKILEGILEHRIPEISRQESRWIYYHLGKVYELQGQIENAKREFNNCLMADPKFFGAQRALGDLSYYVAVRDPKQKTEDRRQLLNEAIESYRAAVATIEKLQRELVLTSRGDLPASEAPLFDVRQHNRTVLSVKAHLRIDKSHCLLDIAKAQSLLRQREEAISSLVSASEVLSLDRDAEAGKLLAEIRNYLAVLYEEMGNYSEAAAEYRKVLKDIDPQDRDALDGIRRLGARPSDQSQQSPQRARSPLPPR